MLCENLVQTQNDELDLSVTVRVTNLDFPRSEEELKDTLLAHALDCHECLSVVLFQEESLAECGCATYKRMFREATDELLRQTPVDPAAHLTDELLEAFFLDRVSDEQLSAMAEHVDTCDNCRAHLQQRQPFYLCVKTAVQDIKDGRMDHPGLNGVLGVSVPDADLHFCTRINDR